MGDRADEEPQINERAQSCSWFPHVASRRGGTTPVRGDEKLKWGSIPPHPVDESFDNICGR
jgi:hypothetical protein